MRDRHPGPVVTFGIDNPANVAAKEIDTTHLGFLKFRLQTPLGEAAATLPMSGRHNLMNALAAAAVATCFELTAAQIAAGLQTAKPPRMRGEVLDFAAGFRVVDDSYNLESALARQHGADHRRRRRTLEAAHRDCREMLELGPKRPRSTAEPDVRLARLAGVDGGRRRTLGCVDWRLKSSPAPGKSGLTETRLSKLLDEAARALVNEVREGDLVLVSCARRGDG